MISVNAKGQLVMFGTGFRARAPFLVRAPSRLQSTSWTLWVGTQGSHGTSGSTIVSLVSICCDTVLCTSLLPRVFRDFDRGAGGRTWLHGLIPPFRHSSVDN